MLVLGRDGIEHVHVRELADRIPDDSLVVLNETRVRRARLACRRPMARAGEGGGRAELLLLRALPDGSWRALGRANKPLRVGDRLEAPGLDITVAEREADGTLRVRQFTRRTESANTGTLDAADVESVEGCDILLRREGAQFRGGTRERTCLEHGSPVPQWARRSAP